jgi:isoquinoline 1-oxidoreductase beta subunit
MLGGSKAARGPEDQPMDAMRAVTRRQAITVVATTAGGLALGLAAPAAAAAGFGPGGVEDAFVRWLAIDRDGTVTVTVHMVEMGQGVTTGLPLLVAEELGVDPKDLRFELAPNGPPYYNRGYGLGQESTGGSASTRGHNVMFRQIGAVAREMLKAAAAARLKVPAAELRAVNGRVIHDASNRALGYGELAAAAAKLSVPPPPALKAKADWTLLGRAQTRLDTPAKVDGSARFGADVQRPGQLVATIRACPAFGGTLRAVDPAPALKVRGVKQVVTLPNAVAVLADGFWPALKGLEALAPDWDLGARGGTDSAALDRDLAAGLDRAVPLKEDGDVADAFAKAAATVSLELAAPLLPHLCMEPMNATAEVTFAGEAIARVDIWLPGQTATTVYGAVGAALGVAAENIHIHRTFLGGGFGRRGEADVALQAVLLAKAARRPVKLIWSREEDVRHDFYRPAARARLTAAVDGEGLMRGLEVVSAAPSIGARRFPGSTKDGRDLSMLSGYADMPYRVPYRVKNAIVDAGVPVGYWRSVNHSQNVFFRETLVEALAARAGLDGLSYRRRLLAGQTRALAVLAALERAAGNPEPGAARGVALNTSHDSLCAQAVDVIATAGGLKVLRMCTAIDVGTAFTPDVVVAQMESSMLDGLSAALFGGVSLDRGGVAEGNFDRLRLLRLAEAPELRVAVVESEGAPVGGVGEPGIPAVAPALTAAVFRATGRQLLRLPVVGQGVGVAV